MNNETCYLPTINNKVKLIKAIRELSKCSLLSAKNICEFSFRSIHDGVPFGTEPGPADIVIDDYNVNSLARTAISCWRDEHKNTGKTYNEVKDLLLIDQKLLDFFAMFYSTAAFTLTTNNDVEEMKLAEFACYLASRTHSATEREVRDAFNHFQKEERPNDSLRIKLTGYLAEDFTATITGPYGFTTNPV